MKIQAKKLLALILACLVLLPASACATGNGGAETQASVTIEAETEAETGDKPDIKKTNYDTEFVITGNDNIYDNAVVGDGYKTGEAFEDSIYERTIRIKDRLDAPTGPCLL